MDEDAKNSLRAPSPAKMAITWLVASGAAFSLGCLSGRGDYGFGQPGILILATVAAVSGALLKRMIWGALVGLSVGFAGAAGILLAISMRTKVDWPIGVLGVGALAALICVITGAAAGFLADVSRQKQK